MRLAREGYESLDPLVIPWERITRDPNQFPDWHIAKVDVARLVVGVPFSTNRGSERLYIKRNPLRTLSQRIKARLRPSKEWREWVLADAMTQKGVQVAQPVFYGETTDSATGDAVIFLATQSLTPQWNEWMTFVRDNGIPPDAWHSLARFTRRIHELGVFHADYRAAHLYFDPKRINEQDDLAAWALIDLDGSQVGTAVSRAQREIALLRLCKSMCRVGMQREQFAEFVALYDPDNAGRWDAGALYDRAHRIVTTR